MYVLGYGFQLLALLFALAGVGVGVAQMWNGRVSDIGVMEKLNLGVTACLGGASAILLYALVNYDFSLEYVFSYTDRLLPLFYRITAFWGGQAGSLLFWALMVAVCGAAFQFTGPYARLSAETKGWYWIFYLIIMAFFSLLLSAWSNPFVMLDPAPADGRGLNPLLQNPGMIIHPPILFLGYGGFVIPGCLALAQGMRRAASPGTAEASWIDVARPFTLAAWLLLTSGIIIGAWWAYMELGWGGYWAWDPVENASLIPWLIGTAALHTCLIETRRNKLHQINIFFMALTTISAFFATYLVRGNVVNSVHAFGAGTVGPALLIFVLAGLALSTFVAARGGELNQGELGSIETREGFLVLTSWMFIAISIVILLATLWPVISSLWSPNASEGLNAGFYNQVCLPLFTVLLALLAVCPWLGWNGGVRNWKKFGGVLGVFAGSLGVSWFLGIRETLPLMSLSVCIACFASIGLGAIEKHVFGNLPSLGAYIVHLGVVLIALGITFSGPFKVVEEVVVSEGQSIEVGPYTATLDKVYEGWNVLASSEHTNLPTGMLNTHTMPDGRTILYDFSFIEAEITILENGREVGRVTPQRRHYPKFEGMQFAESDTLFSLGSEFYASLLGMDSQNRAVLRLSSYPLVNWLWIGGTLMTLAPLLGMAGRKRRRETETGGPQEGSLNG